jgi:hypothetical protein
MTPRSNFGFVDELAALKDGELQSLGQGYAVLMMDPRLKDELEWDGGLYGWASPVKYAEKLMAEGACRVAKRIERRK